VADVAVHIHTGQRAGRVVSERLRGITVLVRVLVMAPMAAGAAIGALALARVFVPAFMLAIGGRFSPDGLNRQQDQQKEEKPTAHAGRIVGNAGWRRGDHCLLAWAWRRRRRLNARQERRWKRSQQLDLRRDRINRPTARL
jgi:hypothetical protein